MNARNLFFVFFGAAGAAASLFANAPKTVQPQPAPLTLVERGRPAAFVVVTPEKASPVERYAAEELRDWTKKTTGVELALATDAAPLPDRAILVGETKYTASLLGAKSLADALAPLGDDGYRLVVRGNRFIVLGSHKRGALYGVYEHLRRHADVEWFASWHAVAPARDKVEVPAALDVSEKPCFRSREPFWFDVLENPAFAARLRVNALSWRRPDPKYGIGEFRFGGGLGSCHTFDRLCSPAKYFDAHPEYFSMVKGKRIKDHTQLCLTNPDVLEIVTSNVLAAIKSDPGAKYFGVSQNDWHNWCECPKCKAIDDEEESHAGTMVRFVNAVAERVEKVYPDKIIETLAYQYTRKPPKKTRLRHNVMPCLCTIECDFVRPIPESTRTETRQFVDYFRAWSAQTEQLYVWDYVTNFRHYAMPFPNVFALQGNVKFFRDNKVSALFEQGAYQGRHGDFAELKAWLLAQWMWNPDLEMLPLLDRFFKGYFGKAAPYARAYFDEVHAREFAYAATGAKPLVIFEDAPLKWMDEAFLARAAGLWAQAAEAVKDEPGAYAYNVRMAALSVDYVRMMKTTRGVWVTRHPERFGVAGDARSLAASVVARVKEGRVRLSEGASTHNARLEVWNAILAQESPTGACDRARLPARAFGPSSNVKIVDDAKSVRKQSVRFGNGNYEWSGNFHLNAVAYDPLVAYKLRFHLRVERPANAKPGFVFWAGVYDPAAKRALGKDLNVKSEDVKGDGWCWVETPPFVPNDDAYAWFAPGRFDKHKDATNPACTAAYVDEFEIVRADAAGATCGK